jgi:hypothetical protein
MRTWRFATAALIALLLSAFVPSSDATLIVQSGTRCFNCQSGGGDPLFFDDFEYAIARTATPTQLEDAFQLVGWSGAIAENGTGFDTSYLYTATSIEDFSGSFPSGSRVLGLEGYPNNGNDTAFLQADYFVAYGDAGGAVGQVPADVWIQLWIYLQNSGSQLSSYPTRNKFLYPTMDGGTGNTDPGQGPVTTPWLVLLGAQGFEEAMGPREENYIAVQAFGAVRDTTAPDGNSNKLYQNLTIAKKLTENAWHLVKIHLDTSTVDGSAEAWICTAGDGGFTQVMDWRVGVTANFEWDTYAETRDGMRVLKMPTTENADPLNNPSRDGFGDNIKFIDDFAMADSEIDLPRYATCGG